jgi:uncharacterized protein (DUF2147 family)
MRRFLYLAILFFLFEHSVYAQSITDGYWINDSRDQIMQFYEKSNLIYGKLVWLKDSLDDNQEIRRDIYNENPKLRSRKIIGIEILTGLKGKKNGRKWYDGSYYYFDGGSNYNANMYLEDDVLYIKGYWWWFKFLGRTKKWHRHNKPFAS